MKKALVIFVVVLVSGLAAIFVFRYQILRYSLDKLLHKALPEYITIERLDLDVRSGAVTLHNLKIANPQGFTDAYLGQIERLTFAYRLIGKGLPEGIEIIDPVFSNSIIIVERLKDGRVNLAEAKRFLEKGPADKIGKETKIGRAPQAVSGTELVKLPQSLSIKDSKVIVNDRYHRAAPVAVTFEDVAATVTVITDGSSHQIAKVSSSGEGHINGDASQLLRWNISLDPKTPKLTMSNRIEASGVSIVTFEPYYDQYSPFVFTAGRFSGILIFDFDNGNIGSTNEVKLSGVALSIKPGYDNAQFWQTTVQDLAGYFTHAPVREPLTSFGFGTVRGSASAAGDIVFDFKIKGPVEHPRFYLGPITKRALTAVAIQKVSSAVEGMTSSSPQGQNGPQSDIEKAKEYIELFKGLIKKKKD